ncbi:unnamed protein product, partial [Musa textilis]
SLLKRSIATAAAAGNIRTAVERLQILLLLSKGVRHPTLEVRLEILRSCLQELM